MDKKIFDGEVFGLVKRRLTLPNKKIVTADVVRHRGAVAIVPLLDAKRVILIRQFRPAIKQNIWEIPAGTLEEKEAISDCVKRELEEEIGYIAGKIHKLVSIFPSPGFCEEKIHIFLAKDLEYIGRNIQKDEVLRPRIFAIKDVMNMINNAKISDSKSIIGLIFADRYINGGL